MTIKHLITLCLLIPLSVSAQFDPSAQKYLDQLATAVQSSVGLEIIFEAKITKIDGEEEMNNETGKLLLKQNYHKLEIGGTESYGDGDNQWLFLPEENEVTIQTVEEGEITPASIFTIYKEGYRFRVLDKNADKVAVELSPENRNSDYVRITLYIDIAKEQLDTFVAQGKNGMITSVNITRWEIKQLENHQLVFDAKQHPDIEIIDLR